MSKRTDIPESVPEFRFLDHLVERMEFKRSLYGPPGAHIPLIAEECRETEFIVWKALFSKHLATFKKMWTLKELNNEQWDEVIGDLICWLAIFREHHNEWLKEEGE
jgi:hypothetical protein